MMRRGALGLLLVLGALLAMGPGQVRAQDDDRSLYWDRYDVDIDQIDVAANRFRVTERYTIVFDGRFTFGTAEIPLARSTGITLDGVTQNGRALAASCGGGVGTYCVRDDGRNISVRYTFFAPVNSGRSDFSITYTARGALRAYPDEGRDVLQWLAVPEDRFDFPVYASTVTVRLPDGVTLRPDVDRVETFGVPTTIDVRGSTVAATATRRLRNSEGLEIAVAFPHDGRLVPPAWQPAYDVEQQRIATWGPWVNIISGLLSVLLGLGGPLGTVLLWYTRGRDPDVGPVPTYLAEPPSDLPAPVVGALVDENAEVRDVMATVLDLAHRGYLVMEETRKEGLFGLGGGSTFTFKRTDKPVSELRAYERRLMDGLFGRQMERTLNDLKNKFYTHIPVIQNMLYDALADEGLFTTKPNTTRNSWAAVGVLVLLLGGAGVFLAMQVIALFNTPLAFCVPVALALTGVSLIIGGRVMPRKTQRGAEEAAKWRAFAEYLRNLEKYAAPEQVAATFDRYLAYATVFGLDKQWIRRFSQVPNTPVPPWYFPTYMGGPYRRGYTAGTPLGPYYGPLSTGGGRGVGNADWTGDVARGGGFSLEGMSEGMAGGLQSMSTGLSQMLDSASSTFTSQPSSSGSSGSWGGGGGFSGGGGGGGGSRGFG